MSKQISKKLKLPNRANKMRNTAYREDELKLSGTKRRIHEQMLKVFYTELHFINNFSEISPRNHRRDFFPLNSALLTSFDLKHQYLWGRNFQLPPKTWFILFEVRDDFTKIENKHFPHTFRASFSLLRVNASPSSIPDWGYCWGKSWNYSQARKRHF